jgi:hypothetical protein
MQRLQSVVLLELNDVDPCLPEPTASIFYEHLVRILGDNPFDIQELAIKCLSTAFATIAIPPFENNPLLVSLVQLVLPVFANVSDPHDSFLSDHFSLGAALIQLTKDPDLSRTIMTSLSYVLQAHIETIELGDVLPDIWWFLQELFLCAPPTEEDEIFGFLANKVLGSDRFEKPEVVHAVDISPHMISFVSAACSQSPAFLEQVSNSPFPTVLYHAVIPSSDQKLVKLAFPLFCLTVRGRLNLSFITPLWVKDICERFPCYRVMLWELLFDGVRGVDRDLTVFPWDSYVPTDTHSTDFQLFFAHLAYDLREEGIHLCLEHPEFIPMLCECLNQAGANDELLEVKALSLLIDYARAGDCELIQEIRENLPENELDKFIQGSDPDDISTFLAVELYQLLSE